MKLKKVLAVILSTLVLISVLSACSGSGGKPESSNAGSTTTNATSEGASENKEPVTLTVMIYGAPAMSGIQTDPVAEKVKELTGITLDVISTANIANLSTELNTMIASNSLPDIVPQQFTEHAKILLDNDVLIPLDDLVAERGQEITNKKWGQFGVEVSKKFLSNDTGKLYFIMMYNGINYNAALPATGPYIRWDIYKKIGSPKVKNMDGLLDVLKQMQDAYPTTENGKKVYAISGFLADGGWNTFSLTAAESFVGFRKLDAYGLLGSTVYNPSEMFNAMENVNSPTFELFRFYNKAYRMGILDPEAVTMKFDQWYEKVTAGQVLYSPLGLGSIAIDGDSNKTLLPVKFEQFENDSFTCQYINAGYGYGITKQCKYPERAMDLLNFCWSYDGAYLLANGVEGESWTEIDGVKRLTPEEVARRDDGSSSGSPYSTFIGPLMDERTNTPITLTNTDDFYKTYRLNGILKDYCDFYKVDSPLQVFTAAKYNTWKNYEAGLKAYDDELTEINNTIQDYALTNLPRLVVAESEEEFNALCEEIIETINKLGAQKLIYYRKPTYTEIASWYEEHMPVVD